MSYAVVLYPQAANFFAVVFEKFCATTAASEGSTVTYVMATTLDFASPGFVAALQATGESLLLPIGSVAAIWEGVAIRGTPGFLSRATPES